MSIHRLPKYILWTIAIPMAFLITATGVLMSCSAYSIYINRNKVTQAGVTTPVGTINIAYQATENALDAIQKVTQLTNKKEHHLNKLIALDSAPKDQSSSQAKRIAGSLTANLEEIEAQRRLLLEQKLALESAKKQLNELLSQTKQ